MSTLAAVTLKCPRCGAEVRGEVGVVVNLDQRLDLRAAILGRVFNTLVCACGERTLVVRTVAAIDFRRRQWIVCYPPFAEVHWLDLATAVQGTFERTLGTVPAGDRGAQPFLVRVVFGYEALREKLVLFDAGLDDHAVEVEKVGVLAGRTDWVGAQVWLRQPGPPRVWGIAVRGTLYEATTAPVRTGPPFAAAELELDAFVSFRRWMVAPRRADPLTFDLDGALNAWAVRARVTHEPY